MVSQRANRWVGRSKRRQQMNRYPAIMWIFAVLLVIAKVLQALNL
jgi:hypothetical protein